jgi:hypothetical protein
MMAGIGLISVPNSFSTLRMDSLSLAVMRLTESPKCPKRPDLPILCRYVSLFLGKSKLITTLTDCMSIPLVKRSAGRVKKWIHREKIGS